MAALTRPGNLAREDGPGQVIVTLPRGSGIKYMSRIFNPERYFPTAGAGWPMGSGCGNNNRLNCLLILGGALIVPLGVNERTPRSGFEMCPICTARIPFSLAMHMVAAHSPNAIKTSA